MVILIFFIAHWYLSLFTQTFFLHRYVSHRMFKMNIFWERCFFFLTFISQGSSFLNPTAYGIMHRKHHAYSDTEKDPHTPILFNNPIKFMLETFYFYTKTIADSKKLNSKGNAKSCGENESKRTPNRLELPASTLWPHALKNGSIKDWWKRKK